MTALELKNKIDQIIADESGVTKRGCWDGPGEPKLTSNELQRIAAKTVELYENAYRETTVALRME